MPLHKFHSVEEMDQETWRTPGDPSLYTAMTFVLHLARRMNPRRYPPGVHRYRSIDEMARVQETWQSEHIQTLVNQRRTRHQP